MTFRNTDKTAPAASSSTTTSIGNTLDTQQQSVKKRFCNQPSAQADMAGRCYRHLNEETGGFSEAGSREAIFLRFQTHPPDLSTSVDA